MAAASSYRLCFSMIWSISFHLLAYPLTLGHGKRLFPSGVHTKFTLKSATPYPSGVVALDDIRQQK